MSTSTMTSCPRCRTESEAAPDPVSGRIACPACGLRYDPHMAETGVGAPPPAQRCQSGERIGDYALQHLLGCGGMSEVYAALKDGRTKPVAFKILLPQYGADEHLRARFKREIAALSQLDHPGIVKVIDHGEHEGRPWLVGDFVGERSLREELRAARGRLPLARVADLARQVLTALDHAHARGCVHRDLKPENLLLDRQGRIRICDFGVAHLDSSADGATLTHLTKTDMVVGTYAYMAPEQRDGGRQVDARCDLYALGVICYEAITGHRPDGRFEDPSQALADHPVKTREAWDDWLLGLLDRDPDARPADAREALMTLPRAGRKVDDEPVVEPEVEHGPEVHLHRADPRRSTGYPHHRQLYRARDDQVLGGVCGGLARYIGINPIWLRIAMVVLLLTSGFILFIGYIVAVLAIPACPDPVYRPRPLNHDLPRRHRSGFGAGVCRMFAARTATPLVLWQLGFVIGSFIFGFVPAIIYLILAIVLPGPQAPPPRRRDGRPVAVVEIEIDVSSTEKSVPLPAARSLFAMLALAAGFAWAFVFAGEPGLVEHGLWIAAASGFGLSALAAFLPGACLYPDRRSAAVNALIIAAAPAVLLGLVEPTWAPIGLIAAFAIGGLVLLGAAVGRGMVAVSALVVGAGVVAAALAPSFWLPREIAYTADDQLLLGAVIIAAGLYPLAWLLAAADRLERRWWPATPGLTGLGLALVAVLGWCWIGFFSQAYEQPPVVDHGGRQNLELPEGSL